MITSFDEKRKWCISIVDYLIAKAPNVLMDEFREGILNLKENKIGTKQLDSIEVNLIEWANGLSKKDVDELNLILDNRFGSNLDDANNKSLKKIKTIVKRGKINNEDEFRLLTTRVDEIYANDKRKSELESINELLADYER